MSLHLTVDLLSPAECPENIGLLVPVPPETGLQSLEKVTIAGAEVIDRHHAVSGHQEALLVLPRRGQPIAINYELKLGGKSPAGMFKGQKSYTALPDAVSERLQRLLNNTTSISERERLVITFAADNFSYGPRAEIPVAAQVLCGLASGNCVDINGFLISAMLQNNIPACYFAGYYFPDSDRSSSADGMHCWISTYLDGAQRHWDLPYSLKLGKPTLSPGLDHIGGHHVAMSTGMDLTFEVGGSAFQTHYLAQPLWLLPAGRVQTASVSCRAQPLSSAGNDTIPRNEALTQIQNNL